METLNSQLHSPMGLFHRCFTDVCMIEPSYLSAMAMRAQEIKGAVNSYFTNVRKAHKPVAFVRNGVAILPVEGVMMRKPDIWDLVYGDAEDTEVVNEAVQMLGEDKEVSGVVLAIDSPGGFMTGGFELASTISQVDKVKPVVTHTSGLMASLAYLFGSQGSAVVATPSSQVGSIGVFSTFTDYTKMLEQFGISMEVFRNKEGVLKAPGIPGTSLTDAHREHIQERVQASFNEFRSTVTKKRSEIPDSAMRGQTFSGREAKAVGMVDSVGDLGHAVGIARRLAQNRR